MIKLHQDRRRLGQTLYVRRRILAEKDIAILKVSRDPDLEAVTGAVSGTPLDL